MSSLESLRSKKITYTGEEYSRNNLQTMVDEYQEQHSGRIQELETLKKTHDDIAKEMTKDVMEQKSAWECLKGGMTGDLSQFRGLLERIPVFGSMAGDRDVKDLLQEKIHVTESRVREVGAFLDKLEVETQNVRDDVIRLNKKVVVAAQNEEKAARFVLELRSAKEKLESELAEIDVNENGAQYREKEAEVDEIKRMIWEHGAKLRLYSNAEDRIASIVKMNNNFLEMLTNLHGNMQSLYESGQEVLDELRGNLAALATTTEASEITLQMQTAMQSLKTSVNKVATLASETSLYLTQNVDSMTSQMKMYDEETQKIIEGNLQQERDIQEAKLDEILALADKELNLFDQAKNEPLTKEGEGSATPEGAASV